MSAVRLALAQTNPVVGDISGNLDACFLEVKNAEAAGAQLVVFGEMVATGYPIEDLASKPSFVASVEEAISEFAKRLETNGLGHLFVVIGHPALAQGERELNFWALSQNLASVIHDGRVIATYAKHHLPNYSVFDEYRNFVPGETLTTFEAGGLKFALAICEDIWQAGGPVSEIAANGVDVTLVLNGSPFETGKRNTRIELIADLAKKQRTAVCYTNLVGGQDDLVFDGDSLVVDATGTQVARAKRFESDLLVVDIENKNEISGRQEQSSGSELEEIWNALVLGLRDYAVKNSFRSVVLGLSGGIDSAVCAALAVDALGKDAVFGVKMPSAFSSEHSISDADDLASRLGINIRSAPIESAFNLFESELGLEGLAAENIQARIRGLILMAISNAENHLTLTTGNKTELSVGYSTIYGDSVGGFAPIKDVMKTLVWELARWRNEKAESQSQVSPIPENSISKPPSAELRPGQVDQDSLPEYDILDDILDQYIQRMLGRDEIIASGYATDLVDRIITLVDRAEWKRRQGAIGTKISGMAFGRDRRLPITNRSSARRN